MLTLVSDTLLSALGLGFERAHRRLFENVEFDLAPGEALQIHGANGSGKSTLLRILCGLTWPSEGAVIWNGTNIEHDPYELRSELIYLGHADGIKLELSVRENLEYCRALALAPLPTPISETTKNLSLQGLDDILVRHLSAGQRRRVALARLLMSKARLWILDEPFTALDKNGTAAVEAMLDRHLDDGGLIVFSSHQPIQVKRPSIDVLSLDRKT